MTFGAVEEFEALEIGVLEERKQSLSLDLMNFPWKNKNVSVNGVLFY